MMHRRINRKGTEKPIEIFVALFIILAVALVMLKLFQNQISEKQKELSDVQQEAKSQEMKEKVSLACKQKCVEASNDGCSRARLASLCAFGSQNVLTDTQYIDLNNDKQMDVDTTLLPGVGVCEDHVYCFHLMDTCCAQRISPGDCKRILTEYWNGQGMDADKALASTITFGSCTAPSSVTPWTELASWTG